MTTLHDFPTGVRKTSTCLIIEGGEALMNSQQYAGQIGSLVEMSERSPMMDFYTVVNDKVVIQGTPDRAERSEFGPTGEIDLTAALSWAAREGYSTLLTARPVQVPA